MKATCPACGSYSIVIDGMSACCDASLAAPERYKTKREGEGEARRGYIPIRVREAVIRSQGNRCIYCLQRLDGVAFNRKTNKTHLIRTHIDHFICWKYSQDNSYENLLAACHICNGIKNDYLFDSFLELQRFILSRRAAKGWVDDDVDIDTREILSGMAEKIEATKQAQPANYISGYKSVSHNVYSDHRHTDKSVVSNRNQSAEKKNG